MVRALCRFSAMFSFCVQAYLLFWAPEKHKADLQYLAVISMASAAYYKQEEAK